MSFNQEKMNINAVISNSAYKRGNNAKLKEVQTHYGDRFELMPEFTDKEHATFRDTQTGKIHMGIRGTDITNAQGGRLKDLAVDALATLGLHKLSNRHKRSDKKLKALIEQEGKDNIMLAAHSLGGSIASDLSHQYDIEAHVYNRGASHLTFGGKFRGLHFDNQQKKDRLNTYYVGTKTPDVLSFASQLDPLQTAHVVEPRKLKKSQKGVLSAHSIYHFYKSPE